LCRAAAQLFLILLTSEKERILSHKIIEEMKVLLLDKRKTDPTFVKEIGLIMAGLASLPESIRKFSEQSAKKGWFMINELPISDMKEAFDRGQAELDKYMIKEIDSNYLEIKQSILESHSKRKDILKCAFDLHESKNWIASIPLFIAQTEGVFHENVDAQLFSQHPKRKDKLRERSKKTTEEYMIYLYSPFETYNPFSAQTAHSSENSKRNGPNRNGILHGSSKHLDYGTKLNSYKCISLLSYVSMVFTQLEK
jgi:hypothetical protein